MDLVEDPPSTTIPSGNGSCQRSGLSVRTEIANTVDQPLAKLRFHELNEGETETVFLAMVDRVGNR
ncbi:hypothetical protein CGZ80_11900 [Rhodopirellula sp. MGV]|nr:hypothetical protein CGZ80_11900 [Rhodopirellula sp. MGV]PNY37746.1 hypothetical protein C2E31_06320 [Rhodopirellula baltica]